MSSKDDRWYNKAVFKSYDEAEEYAWLELDAATSCPKMDIFKGYKFSGKDTDIEEFAKFIREPHNLGFICKEILNYTIMPFQMVMIEALWNYQFPMIIASRGASKTFTISLYCVLRALLDQGSRIVVVGASLRQSMLLFNYIMTIWNASPILQDICGGKSKGPKKGLHSATWACGESLITFLPLGDGETIRGLRACVDPDTIIETNQGMIRIKDSSKYMNNLSVRTKDGFETPKYFVQTRPIPAYEVTTMGGYSVVCSDLHRLWTENGWKNVLDLTTNDKLKIQRGTYVWPTEKLVVDDYVIDENFGFMMGLLIAEGSVSSKHSMNVLMTDKEAVDEFEKRLHLIDPEFHVCRYFRAPVIDPRFKNPTKPIYEAKFCNLKFRNTLEKCGLERKTAYFKRIPDVILRSPKSVVIAFLEGIFWGDGSCFLYKSRQRTNNLGVAYYSVCKGLINDLQVVLSKFDIYTGISERPSNLSERTQYTLRVYGHNAHLINQLLNIPKWANVYNRSFKDYKHQKPHDYLKVVSVKKVDDARVLYDYTLPENESFIGNCFVNHNTHVICDEKASVDQAVFDTVVKGFASVKSTNLVENVKMAAKKKLMARNGMISKEDSMVSSHPTSTNLGGNQIVVAGTASYTFNDFYKNWRQYKAIILSQGDRNVLREHFPDLVGLEGMDSSKYAILRLPYDLVPYGMMDEDILKQGKATTNSTIFNMEYGTIFPDDSDGFYPASSLNACTCPIRIIDQDVDFPARLAGLSDRIYFMGIDPASEHDNFAITIIEHNGLFGSVVYCWTTNRKDFIDKQEKKLAPEGVKDYHSFCIFQIRQLLRRFNIKYILCDAGGGGINVKEGLMDEDKMNPGDVPIFDMKDELHGGKDGAYILKMAQFSDSAWRKNAHYSLKKDFGDRRILFPKFDSSLIAELGTYESEEQLYETLEDVYVDIEKMKQETTHIKARQTENGSESWDVPKMKIHNGQGGKSELKKDRFTSLLLANDIYRFYKDEGKHGINYDFTGLVVGQNKYDQSGDAIKYIGVGARKLKVMGENALTNQVTETSTQNGNIYF